MTKTITLPELNADVLTWSDDYGHARVHVAHGEYVYRVTVQRDTYPEPPDGDYLAPMVYLSDEYRQSYEHADDVYRAWEYFRHVHRHAGRLCLFDPYDLLARYLRIYYGTTVVEFASHLGYSGPAGVFFDTAEWRELTGWHRDPGEIPGAGGNPAAESRSVWHSYADGDVYGVIVERRTTGITTWADGRVESVTEWNEPDDDIWSIWGYYGDDEIPYMLAEHATAWIENDKPKGL
jgi:hypothetical protein